MKPSLLFFILLMAVCDVQAKTYNSNYAFIENKGQIIDQNNNLNPSVKYLWNGNGMKVQLKGNSFSYEVLKAVSSSKYQVASNVREHSKFKIQNPTLTNDSTVIYSHRVDIELLNANLHPQIITEEKSEDYDNYYTTGTPEAGVTFVYHYNKVTYKDIYPNIDLEFISDAKNKKGFKYNFIVRPSGNVADIQLQYNGATKTALNKQGNLAVATTSGDFEESIPMSYTIETGTNVTVHYTANGGNIFGFKANAYATDQTLVIDPWCTYYGSIDDHTGGIATNSNNEVLVTGAVKNTSTNNIATVGAFQNVFAGGVYDGFFVKFSQTGIRLYGTYYGGNNLDEITGNFDIWGNIYIAGNTQSTSGIATTGAYQSSLMGGQNALLAKFNSLGIRIWGTYFGGGATGTSSDCIGLSLDSNGNIFVSGYTTSLINIATIGAYQTTKSGASSSTDAYIMKFDSSGAKIWGTYYGGNMDELSRSIETDNNGNVYISGQTESLTGIATLGAHQTTIGSSNDIDAFLVKFNSLGQIQWGTYYGGNQGDIGYGLTSNQSGDVFMVGQSNSTNNISTSGCHQYTILSGIGAAFLVKFNSLGVRQWGTYYGGSTASASSDILYDVVTDVSGNIIATGCAVTSSGIATIGAFQTNLNSTSDAFLVKFNTSGVRQWGTYFGGNNTDEGDFICGDFLNNILITGWTYSQTGVSTPNVFQTTPSTIFIASFDNNGTLTPTPTITSNSASAAQAVCSGVQPALLTGSSPTGGSGTYGYLWLQSTTSATSGFTTAIGTNNTQNYQPPLLSVTTWYKRIVMSGSNADTTTAIQITVNAAPTVTITQSGNSINSSGSFNSYQWYYNGTLISGATNASYTPTQTGNYYLIVTNSNNCNGQSNTVSFSVGIDEIDGTHLFSVSPNPFKESFVVNCPDAKGTITIMDITGKILPLRQAQGDNQNYSVRLSLSKPQTIIDMKGYAAGVYLLKYVDGEVCESAKMVKE